MGLVRTRIPIKVDSDIIAAQQAGREMARGLGLGLADQTRLAAAISELTCNATHYARGGAFDIIDMSNQSDINIQVVVEHYGRGIPNGGKATDHDFSTGGGFGASVPTIKSLVDQFNIESEPGYTKAIIAIIRNSPATTQPATS